MLATRDGKMWRCQFYYKDWQGVSHKKNKRGFRTKGEAEQWERDFLQQQERNLDINFENFVRIYYDDMEHRLRENTMRTKKFIIDLKIVPYFRKKCISEIKASDIRAWQNALIKEGYSDTYLKTVNNQLSAIFNYAVRYYDLKDNPCRKAGSIGKSHAGEKGFWTKGEFKQFLSVVEEKPEARMAFLLLYWTGMRIGELLALTPQDIDFEKKAIRITKSYQRLQGEDVITDPKTPKSKRVVSMPDFLCEELQDYISRLYGILPTDRIFHMTKSFLHHEMSRGASLAGVKRIRVHDLRHSHVSLLINMGFSAVSIGNRVGHESVDITYRYAHMFPTEQSQMAIKLNEEFKEGTEK